jgi:enediyne biosynthesis protein E4
MRWILFLYAALLFGGAAFFNPGPTLAYRHDNGLTPRRRLPENMGPGVAILDFNRDGQMDIAFPTALFRNEGGGKFSDVSESSGIDRKAFSIGISAVDYDNDGFTDLFVTGWGQPVLYRNLGNGKFSAAPFAEPGLWTVSVFFDANQDGLQDLYLGHFAAYDPATEPACRYAGIFHYCHPMSYPAQRSRFYKNLGEGRFEAVDNLLSKIPGKVFGAVAADVNGDGKLDLFVANDSLPNFLFLNRGNFAFEEIGLDAGVAYSADGNPRSGMGVDAVDYDGDGREDLFVTNFNRERFSIYRNLGDSSFSDEAGRTGIGVATQMYSGWGVKFFDRDHDGDEDLILVNGHPDDRIETLSQTLTHKEPVLYFENRGGRWIASQIGGMYPARGLALADLDNDGQHDIVIGNNGEAPLVWMGTATAGNHWLGVDHPRLRPGAMLRWSVGGTVRQKRINSGGSYLSTSDPRVILGLGAATAVEWLEVQSPSHPVERHEKLKADRYHVLGR